MLKHILNYSSHLLVFYNLFPFYAIPHRHLSANILFVLPLELHDERYEAISKELKELSQTAATEELETKKKIQSRFPDGWKDMYMQLDEQGKQVFWKSIVKEIKISPNEFVEDIIFF